jgi:hypothetical protein
MGQHWSLAKIPFICLVALSIASKLAGQVPYTWSPVPKEDLALKDNSFNPGSAAMILERQIYTDDEKRSQTEWVRIKIFTEEGRGYADVEIPYVAKSTSVEDIRARTVRPDGTVIVFSGTVFDRVVVKYKKFQYEAKVFTLPGVEVGSVIEYAYTMRWKESLPDYVRKPDTSNVEPGLSFAVPTTTWTIQHNLFTRHAVFTFHPLKGGHLGIAKVRMTYPCPCLHEGGTMQLEVSNVPAIQKEDHMPPETMLDSRVHFYYVVGDFGNFWSTYGKVLAQKEEKFIEKTPFLQQAANQIAPPGDLPESRLRKLYSRVQQVRYLNYEPTKTEQEVKREHLAENKSAEDIFRHGYASGNELNLLFTALARAGGFDAWIVQVVDRTSGKFEREVPDGSQLNAMVVLVILNGKGLYLDPASRFCPFGMLPWFETDTEGVRWSKHGGEVVNVQAAEVDSSTIERIAELRLQADGGLEGDLEVVFTGQEALDRRLLALDEDEAGRRKLVEDEIKEWTPGATLTIDSISGWQDTTLPLRVKSHLQASRFAVVTQKRMLFPIAVFQGSRRSSFTYLHRIQPIYLRHGHSELDKVSILLPAGYSLETMSSGEALKTPFAEFRVKRTDEVGVVRMERRAVMNGYFFPADSYGSLWQYFEQLRQSDAENVVLLQLESARAH